MKKFYILILIAFLSGLAGTAQAGSGRVEAIEVSAAMGMPNSKVLISELSQFGTKAATISTDAQAGWSQLVMQFSGLLGRGKFDLGPDNQSMSTRAYLNALWASRLTASSNAAALGIVGTVMELIISYTNNPLNSDDMFGFQTNSDAFQSTYKLPVPSSVIPQLPVETADQKCAACLAKTQKVVQTIGVVVNAVSNVAGPVIGVASTIAGAAGASPDVLGGFDQAKKWTAITAQFSGMAANLDLGTAGNAVTKSRLEDLSTKIIAMEREQKSPAEITKAVADYMQTALKSSSGEGVPADSITALLAQIKDFQSKLPAVAASA